MYWPGKGENIWDRFCHEGGHVTNNETGDVACDSYNLYNEDIALLQSMQVATLCNALELALLLQ